METTLFPGTGVTGDSEGSKAVVEQGTPRLRRPDRRQLLLEPTCLDARLPEDHAARTVWRLVEQLDLSAFYEPIRARGSDPGRPTADPQLLVALWLYAAVDGVGNGRKLDRLCREHDAYKWLCGGVSLNYHTLNDFRVTHEQAVDDLLTRLLVALTEQGLVQVERISQDGKRVRASAGSSSFHRRTTLQQRLRQTRQYLTELKQQPDEAPAESARQRAARQRATRQQEQRLQDALALLPELEQNRTNPKTSQKNRAKDVRVSRTDPDARRMKMADGGIRPAYNVQLATDPSSGAIVGVDVVTSGADSHQSGPLRQQVEQRTGGRVREHLVDEGYVCMEQIGAAERAGVAVYAPLPKGKNGQPVRHSRWDAKHGTTSWRQRMQTPAGQAVYQQRFPASERVNAELQERFGLRAFAVRGRRKVRCVVLWLVLAFNLMHFTEALIT